MAVGAIGHPAELNMASFALWMILSAMFFGSSLNLGFDGWRLPLGFFVGNVGMLLLAVYLGVQNCTFNLGLAEWAVLFGTSIVASIWIVHGTLTGRQNPRILLWGAVIIDVASCYPQFKQYLYDAHDPMTLFGITGWGMWLTSVVVNLVFVDKFVQKLRQKEQSVFLTVEGSIFSIEQLILMPSMMAVMI